MNPSASLHASRTDSSYIMIAGTTGATGWTGFRSSGSDWDIGCNSLGYLIYSRDASAYRFAIDKTSGNIGIGTLSPSASLHASRTDSSYIMIAETTGATGWTGFRSSGSDWDIGCNSLGYLIYSRDASAYRFVIDKTSGNIGIGTVNPTHKLSVNGTIRAKEIIVDTGWSDFVFENDYRLPSLSEVESFIAENKHLPGIPTEAEVKEKGVSVGNISSKLLQKIEELTLYVIDLKKENGFLKAQLTSIQAQLSNDPKQ